MSLSSLLSEIHSCTACEHELPLRPRPIVQVHGDARILIVSQAPGRKAHESGRPFSDPSGERLRSWMGISRDDFYDPRSTAIVPMGFCFPGSGANGDLGPRPECAPLWRDRLLGELTRVQLTVIVGSYALAWHWPDATRSVTSAVSAWREHWPALVPLPHPSPRNNRWLSDNPWFEHDVVPALRTRVATVLGAARDGTPAEGAPRLHGSAPATSTRAAPGAG